MSRCAGNVIKKRCGRIQVMKQEITFDRFVRWVGMGLLVLSILLLVNYLSSVLLPFFVAWLLAYLLYPVVKFIQFKLKVKVRAVAIVIALLLVLAVIALVTYLVVPPMVDQFQKLEAILKQWVHSTTHSNDVTAMISQWIQDNQAEVEDRKSTRLNSSHANISYAVFCL